MAARVRDRQGHRAEVGQPVPDLDPARRPWAGRGALGGRAASRPAAPAPVPADPRGAGKCQGGAGGGTGPGRRPGRPPGCEGGVAVGGLTRALAGLLRQSARLVPAGRRAWVEALWAEAGQVPAGLARLAWRAGGLQLIAREALLARRAAKALA